MTDVMCGRTDAGVEFAPNLPTEEVFSSPVHTDVVVGGPGVSISGVTADGTRIPLIADDQWVVG